MFGWCVQPEGGRQLRFHRLQQALAHLQTIQAFYEQPYLRKCTETFYLSAASASSVDNSCYACKKVCMYVYTGSLIYVIRVQP